jgi:vacuolar-type H+-ATPase subunit E/Vma4
LFIKSIRSFSHTLNESRIDLLSLKENFLEIIMKEVITKIGIIYEKEVQKDRILKSAIEQSFLLLSEVSSLKMLCKEKDSTIINSFIQNFKKDIILDPTLEEKYIGGIIMKSRDCKIQCDNSLAKRIQQAIESQMPFIKKELFNL